MPTSTEGPRGHGGPGACLSTEALTMVSFFLVLLKEGSRMTLLRSRNGVLPSVAFQRLAQHLTQCLSALSKDLLNKELGPHTWGLSRPVLPKVVATAHLVPTRAPDCSGGVRGVCGVRVRA